MKKDEWIKILATMIEAKLISLLQASGYRNIAHSVSVKVQNGTIIVSVKHPAFEYLDRGVRPFQMKPHDKVVPMRKGYTVIFRRITPKSIQEGKWRHPGITPKRFLQRAINEAINQMVKTYGRPE
jgi:hypothetical protein